MAVEAAAINLHFIKQKSAKRVRERVLSVSNKSDFMLSREIFNS